MFGFKRFVTARSTLVGIEGMAMLSKGQVRAVSANAIRAQRAFVRQIFLPPNHTKAVQWRALHPPLQQIQHVHRPPMLGQARRSVQVGIASDERSWGGFSSLQLDTIGRLQRKW